MNSDWDLSRSLESDGQGIRAACVLESSSTDECRILTGTQGGSMVQYSIPSGDIDIPKYQHDHAIAALVSFENKYATGCKDSLIRVFDASSQNLIATLSGHDKAVTSLAYFEPHYLVSGSWDGTAKVWNLSNHSLVATLEGHENSVCVCHVSTSNGNAKICTGSAGIAQNNVIQDHSIRLWNVHLPTSRVELLHKVSNDHDGPIRSVVYSNDTLASCSNDGTVKLRNPETGECLSTLVLMSSETEHAPMLLSVIGLQQNGGWAACAEDGHVVIFQDGGTQQVLRHASCVWNLLELPNGDVATCSQDGVLRIFTLCQDRMAPTDVRKLYHESIQASLQKQSQGPSREEIEKLPKWEMNSLHEGRSEGQVQVFNKDGIAIAAQWSAVSKTWIEVGQVMGSAGGGGEDDTIDGERFDHVLPIEVDTTESGVAKLRIGYNNGENPFMAAQRFLDKHVLPQYHLADVADYIRQRVGHAAPTLGENTTTSSSGAPSQLLLQHLPFKGYKSFGLVEKTASTTIEKMKTKLLEFNALQTDEFSIDPNVLESLLQTLVATSRYHSAEVSLEERSLITKILQHWPPSQAFAALDLARLAVLIPHAARREQSSYWKQVLLLALQQLQNINDTSDKTAAVAVPMLTLRLFCNCFRGGSGSLEAVTNEFNKVLDCTESLVNSTNKNVRLSVATVLLNASSYLHTCLDKQQAPRVVTIISKVLETKRYESEATVRTLVALGTVVLDNKEAQDVAKSLHLVSKVEPAASQHGDKAKAVAKEIYTILSS